MGAAMQLMSSYCCLDRRKKDTKECTKMKKISLGEKEVLLKEEHPDYFNIYSPRSRSSCVASGSSLYCPY